MPELSRREPMIDFALVVWARRKRLAATVFCMMLAGVLTFTVSLPSIYRATATLLVEQRGGPEGIARAAASGELETRLHTITEEVRSRARLRALMDQFNLYPEIQAPARREAAVERLWRDIQVKFKGVEGGVGRPNTVSFSVSFLGRDPETAARVANALASFYVSENLKIREVNRLARLRQQLAQLEQLYTGQYPDVRRLKAEIAAGERRLSDGTLEAGDQLAEPQAQAPTLRIDAAPDVRAAAAELWQSEEFRILDSATPISRTEAPNRLRLILVGLLMTVGATAAAVLLAERLDSSFHSLAELREFTKVPVLAVIPRTVRASDLRRLPSWRTTASIALGLGLVVLVSYYFARGNEQLVAMLSRTPS